MRQRPWGEIMDAMNREADYQDAQGYSATHPVSGWLLILQDEIREATTAWVKSQGDCDALREILQVATVAMRCLQQHGIMERPTEGQLAEVERLTTALAALKADMRQSLDYQCGQTEKLAELLPLARAAVRWSTCGGPLAHQSLLNAVAAIDPALRAELEVTDA